MRVKNVRTNGLLYTSSDDTGGVLSKQKDKWRFMPHVHLEANRTSPRSAV